MSTITKKAVLISFRGCGDTDRRRSIWKGVTEDGRHLLATFTDGAVNYGLSHDENEAAAWQEHLAGFDGTWIIDRAGMLALLSRDFDLTKLSE